MARVALPLAGFLLLLGALAWFAYPEERRPAPLPSPASSPAPVPPPEPEARVAVEPAAPTASTEPPKADPVDAILVRMIEAIRNGDREAVRKLVDELTGQSLPAPLADEKNGALVYLQAYAKMSKLTTAERDSLAAARKGDLSAACLETLRACIARNAEALALLKEAGAYERCRFPIDYEGKGTGRDPMLHVGPKGSWLAKDLLLAEGILARADGVDDAPTAKALLCLAESVAEEPTLMSQGDRWRLLKEVNGGDPATIRPILPALMRMEMAGLLKMVLDDPQYAPAIEHRPMGEYYVETMRQLLPLCGRPYFEVRDTLAELSARVDTGDWRAKFTRMVWQGSLLITAAKAEAALNSAIDPFSGKAMVERNGLRYSVGPNGIDDGGALDDIVIRR